MPQWIPMGTPQRDGLLEIINEINVESLNWKDPIASQVLDDKSSIINSLDDDAKIQFMVRIYFCYQVYTKLVIYKI